MKIEVEKGGGARSPSTLVSPPPAAEELHHFLHLFPSTVTEERTGQNVLTLGSKSHFAPHKDTRSTTAEDKQSGSSYRLQSSAPSFLQRIITLVVCEV